MRSMENMCTTFDGKTFKQFWMHCDEYTTYSLTLLPLFSGLNYNAAEYVDGWPGQWNSIALAPLPWLIKPFSECSEGKNIYVHSWY